MTTIYSAKGANLGPLTRNPGRYASAAALVAAIRAAADAAPEDRPERASAGAYSAGPERAPCDCAEVCGPPTIDAETWGRHSRDRVIDAWRIISEDWHGPLMPEPTDSRVSFAYAVGGATGRLTVANVRAALLTLADKVHKTRGAFDGKTRRASVPKVASVANGSARHVAARDAFADHRIGDALTLAESGGAVFFGKVNDKPGAVACLYMVAERIECAGEAFIIGRAISTKGGRFHVLHARCALSANGPAYRDGFASVAAALDYLETSGKCEAWRAKLTHAVRGAADYSQDEGRAPYEAARELDRFADEWERGHREGERIARERAAADAEALAAFSADWQARDEARRAEALALAHGASFPEFGGSVQFRNSTGDRSAIAGPDASGIEAYRLTCFDADGPIGHSGYASLADACAEALSRGYLAIAAEGIASAPDARSIRPRVSDAERWRAERANGREFDESMRDMSVAEFAQMNPHISAEHAARVYAACMARNERRAGALARLERRDALATQPASAPLATQPARVTGAEPYATDNHERPCAAPGLTSYRARGMFGWVMIGARDDADAMREALRSTDKVSTLEKWDGTRYVPLATQSTAPAAPPAGDSTCEAEAPISHSADRLEPAPADEPTEDECDAAPRYWLARVNDGKATPAAPNPAGVAAAWHRIRAKSRTAHDFDVEAARVYGTALAADRMGESMAKHAANMRALARALAREAHAAYRRELEDAETLPPMPPPLARPLAVGARV